MANQQQDAAFTFAQWLKAEVINWILLGALGGVCTVVGTENFVRGGMVLASVLVVGMITWAIRARW